MQENPLVLEGWFTHKRVAESGSHNFPEDEKVIVSVQIFFLGCKEVNNFFSVNCGVKPLHHQSLVSEPNLPVFEFPVNSITHLCLEETKPTAAPISILFKTTSHALRI